MSSHDVWAMALYSVFAREWDTTLTFPDDQVSARKVQYPVVDLLFEGDPAQSLRYFTTRRTTSLCGRRGAALCSVTMLSTKDISG